MQKNNIEEMQIMAESKGGRCISKNYINNKTKLEWECKLGHRWKAVPYSIKAGKWCPICSQNVSERICKSMFEYIFKKPFPKIKPSWLKNSRSNRMELDGYCKEINLAFEYNGIQHYKYNKKFHQKKKELLNERKNDDILKKRLCKQHNITLIVIPYYIKFENMLSYILDECNKKGIKVNNIKNINYRKLDIFSPKKIEEIKKIATKNGGKCLSKSYINKSTKLMFECGKGHKWQATPDSIKRGSWCSKCAHDKIGKSKRLPISTFKKIIEKKGGVLLSDKYEGNRTKLKIKCKNGHSFSLRADHLLNGSWCLDCYNLIRGNSQKLSIEEMNKIASKKGGKCLSKEYINANTKLKWECKYGHQWETKPNHVKRGHWCPICARKK